jgi:F-type H+-transporting ATPase subunit epsilon
VSLEVHLVTPEREVWSGPARMLVARGVEGEVGILAGHAPLLVRLAIGPLRILTDDEGERVAVVDGGFLHVTSEAGATRADVLASQAELLEEIDVELARARAAELEQQIQNHDTHLAEAELARVRAELRKAQVRIGLAG